MFHNNIAQRKHSFISLCHVVLSLFWSYIELNGLSDFLASVAAVQTKVYQHFYRIELGSCQICMYDLMVLHI